MCLNKISVLRAALSAAGVATVGMMTSGVAFAQDVGDVPSINSGDTAWVLISSALVLMMALPGLGLFYGGLVRARNVLSVILHCFVVTCAVSLLWAVFGYSLVFSGVGSILGSFETMMLGHLSDVRLGTSIPESAFALFQMTFAVFAPVLAVGAFVERVRFGWVVAFSLLWSFVVYIPVAHWMWGGGWLAAKFGALDFAGGIVVHMTAGVSALIIAMLLGPRKGFTVMPLLPHSPVLTMIGAGLLWVGWYGFSGGSALLAGDGAASAILNTHFAACAAALTWIVIERILIGRVTPVGFVKGVIAGLATITPAAGFVGVEGAIVLGLLGSIACFFSVRLVKSRLKIDDSLDVFALFGVGGIVGASAMPLFISISFGGPGYTEGGSIMAQFGAQVLAVGAVAAWTIVATLICALFVAIFFPMRVSEESEQAGLDITSHGSRGWEMD